MTLLSPYLLFAASAILVPIAIHLWNKRQGKTVKVGSLRWLEASASRRWSSIKLNQVWLLVLRCCIIILLAVALAKPVWEGEAANRQANKAILISPELLHSTALRNIKPTVDVLLQRGYSLHNYGPTFEKIPLEQWQAISSNPTDSAVSSGNHWGLLPALAQRYSQQQDSVWLFTSDQQRHFAGTPAPLQKNIRWVPVSLESVTHWVQAAYAISPDSLLLILGRSNREGTTYHRTRIVNRTQTANLSDKQVQLTTAGDSLLVQWGSNRQRVLIHNKPVRVSIAHSKAQQPEVRYLQATVQAIRRYTGIPMEVQLTATTAQPDPASDWLFWLSSETVPESWLQQVRETGATLWVQPTAGPTAAKAHLVAAAPEKIILRQLSKKAPDNKASIVWHTSQGEPLLTVQPMGSGNIYHFRSGFSPEWSQLGQSAQFPEIFLPLLLPQEGASLYDARALDEAQLNPLQPATAQAKSKKEEQFNLLPWVVALAFLLFLAERLLTNKRTTA